MCENYHRLVRGAISLALGACVFVAASGIGHAAAGDPIPGVDVSLEQVPGGIVVGGNTGRPSDCDGLLTTANYKKVGCVGKAVMKAQRKGLNVPHDSLLKCQAKYDTKVVKARAAGDCFMQNQGDPNTDAAVNQCTRAIVGTCVGRCTAGPHAGIACQYASDCPGGSCSCTTIVPPCGIYLTTFGSTGTGDGQFTGGPFGLAADGSGNLYAVDSNNPRIQKFDASGAFLTKWGSSGPGDGQFNDPSGVAVDGSGNVYVADHGNFRIQKFDASGTFLAKWGSSGTGDGQFNGGPRRVAADGSGNVYVLDVGNRIQKFDASGTFLTKWGSFGTGDGQFTNPTDIAVDSSGNVYVADNSAARIQKFDPSGAFLAKWGGAIGFGISADVGVYATNNDGVQKFNATGTFLTQWGSTGSGDGQFDHAASVATDGNGSIYIADSGHSRVQKFACP